MTDYVAALPMYDWSETRAETDAQWGRLRDRLRTEGFEAPEHLTRRNADLPPVPGGIRDATGRVIAPDPATLPPDALDLPTLWRHPRLLFAQTCWGPLETTDLGSHVKVIGQPDYSDVAGGEGEFYSSAIVMRRSEAPPSVQLDISPTWGETSSSDGGASFQASKPGGTMRTSLISPLVGETVGRPEGGVPAPAAGKARLPLELFHKTRLAFNSRDSMSGILALTRDLEAAGESLAIFNEQIETGAHRASVMAVAEGKADVAAIDCRTWSLIRRFEPAAEGVRVVGWTGRRKGLPFISNINLPPRPTRSLVQSLRSI